MKTEAGRAEAYGNAEARFLKKLGSGYVLEAYICIYVYIYIYTYTYIRICLKI